MRSHSLPRKLLEQFAYDDPVTRSKRLWRYHKGRAPWPEASPRNATRWDGHFADPADPDLEAEIEARLKKEFEDPVNEFIELIGFKAFYLTFARVRSLTRYMTMLFARSRGRRQASHEHTEITLDALRSLLNDEAQLTALIANHQMDFCNCGFDPGMVTRDVVVGSIEGLITKHSDDAETQSLYVQSVQTMMDFVDENMLNGHWGILRTEPDKPFVIGDAGIVTWERSTNNTLQFGLGFARPNVEVFLPVSPTACLHVLPRVERTRQPLTPATTEVNIAQAALAAEDCFTNIFSPDLDAALQPHFGTCRIGIEAFSPAAYRLP